MALTDKLTAIADAIRKKTGGTDTMQLGEMPDIIRNIGGGGLPSGVTALASGTFTPASDVTTPYPVPHGLGVIPNFFVVFVEGQQILDSSDFNYYIVYELGVVQNFMQGSSEFEAFRIARYGVNNGYGQLAPGCAKAAFANTANFMAYASSTYSLKAGVTYRWIAGILDLKN